MARHVMTPIAGAVGGEKRRWRVEEGGEEEDQRFRHSREVAISRRDFLRIQVRRKRTSPAEDIKSTSSEIQGHLVLWRPWGDR